MIVLVQTFDFLFSVWESKELKNEILCALERDDKKRIIICKYILTFEPQQKIVRIEYDGERFHTQETKIKEQKKDEYYYNKGIKLIRIKEKKNSKTHNDSRRT